MPTLNPANATARNIGPNDSTTPPAIGPASTPTPSPENDSGGGWFPVAKADLRTVAGIPGSRKHSALAVWVELLKFANWKKSLRFNLDQATIARYAVLGRRTVGYCLADLRDAGLLAFSAPRLKNGRQSATTIKIRPSVLPYGAKPSAENAHGSNPRKHWAETGSPHNTPENIDSAPCADDARLHLRSNKQQGATLPSCKKDADPAPAPDGAGRPASGKKPKRRDSWMPEGGLK